MTVHPNILDQPEPLKKWVAGSVILHGLLAASLVSYNVIGHQAMQLGDPHGGATVAIRTLSF